MTNANSALGLDVGGTKISGQFRIDGKIVRAQVCAKEGCDGIFRALKEAGAESLSLKAVCAAVAGLSRPEVHKHWQNELSRHCGSAAIELVGDFVAAFRAALEKDGVMVIAGTGSIVYGERGNQQRRVGGRGWEYSDLGSGAWLTGEAIQHALFELETAENKGDQLLAHVCEALLVPEGIDSTQAASFLVAAAREQAEQSGRGFLAPHLVRWAEQGDTGALALIASAAGWLAAYTRAAAQQLGYEREDRFTVATVGGLWQAGELIRLPFCRALAAAFPNASVVPAQADPVEGAFRRALSLMQIE
jgi:N-acetylglucosamine kinase-like BadF-type ATPase